MAAPVEETKTKDVKKSYPSEIGLDEEVRQLLDLKGLSAQPKGLAKPADQSVAPAAAAAAAPAAAAAAAAKDQPAGGVSQLSMVKSQGEALKVQDGVKDHTAQAEERVTSNGELLRHMAKQVERHEAPGQPPHTHHQVQLDIPSADIHDTLLDEDGRRSVIRGDHKGPRVRYTPLDLALYVYKTGDEEGVTLAIQELITEGLMTAEEALNYLHDTREHLRYLNQQDEDEEEKETQTELKTLAKKNALPLPLTEMNLGDPEGMLAPEMDYEGILEKLRSQDYVYTEYSLEEVIYQLAKILFKQAMHREGDVGSEKALQEVAALLEKEATRGAITPEVEKKVLDVMVNSLVDSLNESEYPVAPGSMMGGTNFKLPSETPFPLGSSSLINGPNFRPTNELFQLSKATAKREASEEKTVEEKKD